MKSKNSDQSPERSLEKLQEELEAIQLELTGAKERERRAVADYQNLVRRSQEERQRVAKFAALDVVETLLEPLTHLALASDQLQDQGLAMVVGQLWQKLNEIGLEEISPLGQPFDVNTMEAVADPAKSDPGGSDSAENKAKANSLVAKVVAKGYKLNGEVIRHAKVIVG